MGKIRSTTTSGARAGPFAAWLLLTVAQAAWCAEDPGLQALQQHRLQRQQQEEALQLRMRQQQRTAQSLPADARQKQALESLRIDQQQRQQVLHYRQSIEPLTAQPTDDEGTRRAKAEMGRLKAQQQDPSQVRQSEQAP